MKKYLSPIAAWALSFGYAVGWGSLVMPGTSFLPGAGPLGTVAGILLGALCMVVIGWNYHVLVNRHQCSGGAFNYAQDAFGADYGFLTAWFLILAYLAILWANATALVLVARHTLGDALQFGFHYSVAGFDIYFGEAYFGMLSVVAAGALCLWRKRLAARVNLALAVVFLAGIVVLFAIAASRHTGGMASLGPAFSPLSGKSPAVQIVGILGMMPWAFVGFEAISNSSEEFAFDARRTFTILLGAVISAALAYAMLALLPVFARPDDCATWADYIARFREMGGPDALPTYAATLRLVGGIGKPVFFAMMLAATFTGIFGAIVASSRLLHGLAVERILPEWFGRVGKDGSPVNAIWGVVGVSFLVPFLGRTATGWPVDVSSIGAAIAYCTCSAAALKFAAGRRRGPARAAGIAGIVLSVVSCLILLVPNYFTGDVLAAESYMLLAIWSLAGFWLYRQVFKHSRDRFGRSSVVWVGVLVLVLFSLLMWMRQSTKEAIQDTGGNIARFYEERRRGFDGADLNESQTAQEERFMAGQMGHLGTELLEYDLVLLCLLALTLVLVFSIYKTQQFREKTLAVAHAKAEESSKAKSGFLSNMSHDIRTPMNAIIGYTELSKRKGATEADLREYLRKIEASSHHLLALVNDALEMGRIESGKMELEPAPINLGDVLDEVEDMFATQMSVKKLRFATDSSGLREPRVLCDKNRLNRVLLNLVSNAYKFTPEGGRIDVTATQTGEDGPDTGIYELRVKDSGIGMGKEFAAHVFEAFERERTSTVSGIQGTGLGMAITKNIVDLMKGTIRVETEQGKGSEFIVTLPLPYARDAALPEASAATAKAAAEAPADFSSRRLLLVEDNEINRDIATAILADMDFEVDTAANGREAVEKVAQGGVGFYDLILMDVQMPVMDGYEATRAIRAMDIPGLSDIPIAALSANAFESDVRDALAAGMNAHIAKPFVVSTLKARLAELLANVPVRHRPPLARLRAASTSAALMHRPLTPHDILETLRGVGCDVDGALSRLFSGDEKFYAKMLAKLPENTAMARMRAALDAGDAAALFEASHELKGVYANLGITPLYEPCREIVEIARAGTTDGVEELIGQMEELHAEVITLARGGME